MAATDSGVQSMGKPRKKGAAPEVGLQKCLTGIKGFDEITEGGIPRDRITLLCGGTGTGKTLLGLDFLLNGASHYGEPGVFMSFEETEDELY
ncbi:MAG: ATPase domain-containing protein, partial [Burkholderiaceae bacterium]